MENTKCSELLRYKEVLQFGQFFISMILRLVAFRTICDVTMISKEAGIVNRELRVNNLCIFI
jgi:hypothetical protein